MRRALTALAISLPLACPAQSCRDEPALQALDFWVGEWEVDAGGSRAGHNRIEKILDGCVIREDWTGTDGSRGQSWFFLDPALRTLRQIWLTDRALRPGGAKDKHLVGRPLEGALRFQGEIPLPDGRRVLDRTTLRPLPDGSVRQRIEVSRDGGETWQVNFDAVYRRAGTTE